MDADDYLLSNLGEYAFGKNPRGSDNFAIATADVITIGPDRFLTITFTRRHQALDLTYFVETTDSLAGAWNPATVQVGPAIDLGNGIERVTFRGTIPLGNEPRFTRVRAVKP